MKKIISAIWKHKVRFIIVLLVVAGGGYFVKQKFFPVPVAVRYVESTVERGVLSTVVSGSGQVSASNQIDLKPKAAGDIIYVGAIIGQEVKAGTLLLSINAGDAIKAVHDAQDSLETAKLNLDKLKAPPDELTLLQSQNSLAAVKESLASYKDNLAKSYEDAFNTVATVFSDFPNILGDFSNVLLNADFENHVANVDWYFNHGLSVDFSNEVKMRDYHDNTVSSYQAARAAYDASVGDYQAASRTSATATIESLIDETYETAKKISDAVKIAGSFIDSAKDSMIQSGNYLTLPATIATHQSLMSSYASKINSHLSSLLSARNSIESAKNNIVSISRSIAEKTISYANILAGPDALDLRSSELTVTQRQTALSDAQAKLADYSVRASFNGVIAAFTAKKGDTVSMGSTVGTLITKSRQAIIAFNEIDVAKVAVGQKATLAFDAIDGLTITGEVVEVDTLGTVSQGVVSYNVKVLFDVQDERVKPGMTVSVNVILSSKPNILLVPNSAVKSEAGGRYVQQLDALGNPIHISVQIGDSNDTMTEIISGLNEGDKIVTQTISAAVTTSATASGGVPAGGFTGGGGAALGGTFRALR